MHKYIYNDICMHHTHTCTYAQTLLTPEQVMDIERILDNTFCIIRPRNEIRPCHFIQYYLNIMQFLGLIEITHLQQS